MPDTIRKRPIEIDEDIVFQERSWAAERIAWGVMALLILGAILGLFGSGLVDEVTKSDPAAIVSSDLGRFHRQNSPSSMTSTFSKRAVGPEGLAITLSPAFVEAFDIERIQPAPTHSIALASGLQLVFAAKSQGPAVTVRFELNPRRVGLHHVTYGVTGAPPLQQVVFVYP